MAKVKNLDFPSGWLIDPNSKWAIHFDLKKDAYNNIDMWGLDAKGQPLEFKSRRKATQNDCLKTWNQLISSNWTELDFGKAKSA